jgi:hypothetical protein
MKYLILLAFLSGAAVAAPPKPALTQELAFPGGTDGYMSCDSNLPTTVGGTATPGNRSIVTCTLGNLARGTAIPASTRFVTSYISFAGNYEPPNCLQYVTLNEPAQSMYGIDDFLPLNSILSNGGGLIWFSGGGAYHTVWEPGQTPSVSAKFCDTGAAQQTYLRVTVHGHYESF